MVVDLITVRQIDQFLSVIRDMIFRGDDSIGNKIINKTGAGGDREVLGRIAFS